MLYLGLYSGKVSEGESQRVHPARLLLCILYPMLPCVPCLLWMAWLGPVSSLPLSRPPLPFLSLYLFLFFTYLCVLPLASFPPPILCLRFVESRLLRTFFQASLVSFSMPDSLKFLLIPYPAQSKPIFLVLLVGANNLPYNLIVCMIGLVLLRYKGQMVSNSPEL